MSLRRIVLVSLLVSPLGACASCFGDEIATGVARLSVLHAGAIVMAVRADTTCGFSSSEVQTFVEGEVGALGRATRVVDGCSIELTGRPLSTDCHGVETVARGHVVVTATETIVGYVTGDPDRPIVPLDEQAASMTIDARLSGFSAIKSDEPATMVVDGPLRAKMTVVLAPAASNGACSIPTNDVSFSRIESTGATIRLDSGRGHPVVEAGGVGVEFSAVVGTIGEVSNHIDGAVTIFDERYEVVGPLFDDFDPTRHRSAFACTSDLASPRGDCSSPLGDVADGVARLSTAFVGRVAAAAAAECFDDPSKVELSNDVAVGRRGVATRRLRAEACVLRFDGGAIGAVDCHGHSPTGSGVVRIEGVQTIRGRTTGDVRRPAAPDSTSAMEMKLDIVVLEPFEFMIDADTPTITIGPGWLEAEVRPTMALDASTGLCTAPTPHARIEWRTDDLPFGLGTDGLTIGGTATVEVAAQHGRGDDGQNSILGRVEMAGQEHRIDGALLPNYDPVSFKTSFECDPNVVEVSADQCGFDEHIAADVARVLIAGAGHTAALLADRSVCSDPDGPAAGDIAVNGCEAPGYNDWDQLERDFDACRFEASTPIVMFESCSGETMTASGRFDVVGNDLVRTRLCTDIDSARDLFDFIDDPHPRAPDVSRVLGTQIELRGFETARRRADGGAEFEVRIDGRLDVDVTPIFGERAEARGRFDVPTPIVRVDRARFEATTVELEVDGLRLTYEVEADLSAMIGAYAGDGNRLEGTLVLDGTAYRIDAPFDPAFTAASQLESYSCDPALAAPLPL